MQPGQEVISGWTGSAPYWEKHREIIRQMFAPVSQALIEDGRIASGHTVLDIVTGPGEPALTVAAWVGPEGKVVGIDLVPEMVEGARRATDRLGFRNAQFEVASADRLPFPDDTFDAVISRFGVMFFPFPVDAVREPIQSEMTGGFRNFNRASLSSSIWIVCRKRSKGTAAGWQEKVLEEMKKALFEPRDTLGGRNILQYYFDLGITGPDFIWAALGPALEAYSAHPFVKRTEGGIMTVSEFLREVRRLVLQFCLGELPGFRDFQRETQGRGESLERLPGSSLKVSDSRPS